MLYFEQLKMCNCRWPIKESPDGKVLFCGEAILDGYPYCAEHVALAYSQPSSRRAKQITTLLSVLKQREIALKL